MNRKLVPIDYSGLPCHLREGTQRYIEHGVPTGGFFTAVITNNLQEACARADLINRHQLFNIVHWFYNEAPHGCCGSPEKMDRWLQAYQERKKEVTK